MCTVYAAVPAASAHDGKKKIDATLYEVTENMSLDDLSMPTLRTATAALQGTAKLGSPLCPVELVHLLAGLGLLTRADKPCSITAVGNDAIETATGSGSVDGTFAVVINLDNTTDAPEFVAMTGTFKGSMQVVIDTTAKPPRTLPLINLNDGTFTPTDVPRLPDLGRRHARPRQPAKFGPAPFTGRTFRLPLGDGQARLRHRAFSNRDAFYLGDHGQLIKVQPTSGPAVSRGPRRDRFRRSPNEGAGAVAELDAGTEQSR